MIVPTVGDHMSSAPHSIGVEQTLERAHAMMREFKIRHLPVLHGGKLVGVVTDRDLGVIETLRDVDPAVITVEEAMTAAFYAVAPQTPLEEVVGQMAIEKYGSALVVAEGHVIGILTTVDVCRALHGLLQQRRAPT